MFLAPVDAVWALRPSLEHLDAARPQPRAAEPPKEEEKPMLTALQASARATEPHQALPLLNLDRTGHTATQPVQPRCSQQVSACG